MFYRMIERFRSFMQGRYGLDQLGAILLGVYFVGNILIRMLLRLLLRMGVTLGLWSDLLQLLPYGVLGWAVFRMLSRNIPARCVENGRFSELWTRFQIFSSRGGNQVRGYNSYPGDQGYQSAGGPAQDRGAQRAAKKAAKEANKDYKVFACPGCGQQLRVPKKKGKIIITCPKCGNEIQKKT